MGVCFQKPPKIERVIKSSSNKKVKPSVETSNQRNLSSSNYSNKIIYTMEEDHVFQDMPEWPGEIYKGYGIKRMKGYKCNYNIDELYRLRDEFWRSKLDERDKWIVLHQACIYDHIKAEEFLYKKGFKTIDGCINNVVDQEGRIYTIPNYCINDPYFEFEILPPDENNEKHKSTIIKVTLVNLYENHKTNLHIPEATTGIELKKSYAKRNNIDLDKNNIKLIFGGGFIKDEEMLYQHKILDGFVIQVVINKIEPEQSISNA